MNKHNCFGWKLLVYLILFSALGHVADFAFAANGGKRLPRSLGGITLGVPIEEFRKLSGWKEITGAEKQVFFTVFPDERLFSKSVEDLTLVCGLIRNRVYKVGMIVLPKYGRSLLTDYKQKYGSSQSVPAETPSWEDDATILEVFPHEKYFNIVITDKELFALAAGLGFSPLEMQQYIIQGFDEEGITVKCSIAPSIDQLGYDYHITHVHGFDSEQDFLFASMGTVAVNSELADFKSNWLYMHYGNASWRIETNKCRKFFRESQNESLSPSEMLNLVDIMLAELERLK